MIGVVAGKFWPYHKGHALLLHTAAASCDFLHIFLVVRDHEFPNGAQRFQAIANDLGYEGARFQIHIVGDIETFDGSEESSVIWAAYTEAILGFYPDVVFSSEEYGERWAKNLGAEHVMVDLDRKTYPVSGTEIRSNIYANKNFLPAQTRAQILPRVVVMGAESTGTTTLANALGERFGTLVVPEFGRLVAENYLAEHGERPPLNFWDDQQFRLVAHGQNAMEERMAREANGLLICDTDSLATAVWYERYHNGKSHIYFDNVGMEQAKRHDLYIITDPEGVPWVDDGTRDGEKERKWMHESFLFVARKAQRFYGVPFIVVSGDHGQRMNLAIKSVNKVLDKHAYAVVG